jgi:hypothetical protein
MARILRAKNLQSPKTPKGVTGNPKSGSFHDEDQLTRKTTSAKTSVRILHATDPATSNAFTPVMDQFTNNPNKRYDPSKAPGAVTKLDSTPPPPQGVTSGHQKVIQQTNQMKTGGKTLVRRTV